MQEPEEPDLESTPVQNESEPYLNKLNEYIEEFKRIIDEFCDTDYSNSDMDVVFVQLLANIDTNVYNIYTYSDLSKSQKTYTVSSSEADSINKALTTFSKKLEKYLNNKFHKNQINACTTINASYQKNTTKKLVPKLKEISNKISEYIKNNEEWIATKYPNPAATETLFSQTLKNKIRQSKYIVSIGVYDSNYAGFHVSVYGNLDNPTKLPQKTTATASSVIGTDKPNYTYFITVGTMDSITKGAMAFGNKKDELIKNALYIYEKPEQIKNKTILCIGKGVIKEMKYDPSENDNDFMLSNKLSPLGNQKKRLIQT